jgi:hypothetical protein
MFDKVTRQPANTQPDQLIWNLGLFKLRARLRKYLRASDQG